jgi:aspartyl-tRNA(Asn)/glutamyl-tRNA(Gln) amidotransferase subunit C
MSQELPERLKDEARLIDREQVRHIAYLIRLALTDEEVDVFSAQLSTIVDYFDRLAEVDVEGVPAYQQPEMPRARLREDVVQPSMPRDDFLANAPQHQDGLVRVPVVLSGPETDEG